MLDALSMTLTMPQQLSCAGIGIPEPPVPQDRDAARPPNGEALKVPAERVQGVPL